MKLMYLRSGPYEPSEKNYNLQEIGMLSEFCKLGYDCDLYYFGKTEKNKTMIFDNGTKLNIKWIKGIRLLRSGLYPQLLRKNHLKQYDVIFCSEYSQVMTFLLSRKHDNFYCYNGPYYNLFKLKFMERIYDKLFLKALNKNVKRFFCKSILSENFLNTKGLFNTTVVGVGQNMEKFKSNPEIFSSTNSVINFIDKNTFLYVGSIDDRKNFPFLIKIMKKTIEKYPEIKLQIIGSGNKKYIKENLKDLSDSTLRNINIIESLQNEQLQYIYPKVRCLLLPSKLEIFGMVLLEAMSFGIPVISSDNGGSRTLINNYFNGIIADINSEDEWLHAIDFLRSESNMEKLSMNAQNTIKDKFTWEKIVNQMNKEINGGI